MWLATKYGFYSIVRKRKPSARRLAEYHVRARVRSDLENLLAASDLQREIFEWAATDYRFRFLASEEDIRLLMRCLAENLDYSNFKSQIARTPDQRAKLTAYHKVWEQMARLQR
jgi:hypothetical protein